MEMNFTEKELESMYFSLNASVDNFDELIGKQLKNHQEDGVLANEIGKTKVLVLQSKIAVALKFDYCDEMLAANEKRLKMLRGF